MDTGTERTGTTARLTPYELVFMEGEFESRVFPRIREEAVDQGVDPLRREVFDFLSTVGELVREVSPEDAPPESLEQYRALLFHAYHFWRVDRQLLVLEKPTARYLVESSPGLSGWEFRLPGGAAYLQLPANLFWSSISPESQPEPVDGFFVTVSEAVDPMDEPFTSLEILVVLGIHRSRAGFSVIPLDTPLGAGIQPAWEEEERGPRKDFDNVLPGGEISGLYSILTAAEVLKLAARVFWYVDAAPDALVEVTAPGAREADADPPPTQLDHVLVTLGAAGA
jgi:hypothetical protein